mgnify:CR=1 FL=1
MNRSRKQFISVFYIGMLRKVPDLFRNVSRSVLGSCRHYRPVGIVGLPNVGKSTLFNALTKSELAAMANYPFCTIDPNKADILV